MGKIIMAETEEQASDGTDAEYVPDRLPEPDRRRLVEILKAANLHGVLLNDFQRAIVVDRTVAYARFGNAVQISTKQWTVLIEIEWKLNLHQAYPD